MNNAQQILNKVSSSDQTVTSLETISVQYITNSDGSLRWIWPLESNKPLFLKFYNVNGWKAKIFAFIARLVFAFSIQRWIFKTIEVNINKNGVLALNDWAIFTGTVGPNQKYILYTHHVNGGGSFTKISLTIQGQILMSNEKKAIEKLACIENLNFKFPVIINCTSNNISFKENPDFNSRTNQWTEQHSKFYQSIENINTKEYAYNEFAQKHEIEKRIEKLKAERKKLPSGIIKKLSFLHQSLYDSTVKTHFAHGDFTPWNVFCDQDGCLYVYDWELSNADYPMGFDFIHYKIQDGIMTQRKSWSIIKNEIYANAKMSLKIQDCEQSISLYLLINVLKYLETYEKQEAWHEQIYWCLETWNVALSDILSSSINSRELIVLDIFDHLKDVDYSGLKLNDQAEKVSEYSDVDILMEKSTCKNLIHLLENHPLVSKLKIQSGTAMTKIHIVTIDNQVLSLDAIHRLMRKSIVYMSVKDLIKKPFIDRHGIKKMDLMDSLQFIGLFYGLNNSRIPEKYRKYSHIAISSNGKLDNIINEQFSTGNPDQKALLHIVNSYPENKGLSAFKNKVIYIINTLMDIINQKGMIITFSGVDGAGKSTIIENTKIEIEKKFRKRVKVIRHRPSILPILSVWTKGKEEAEKSAANTLPRLGQNKSLISSVLRFAYYYIDYLFGQFYIYIKYVLRGDIVLYDRYYFDFINDSLRSNITLPKWIMNIGYYFLLKPELNIFLYADAKTILSRKKELSENSINVLTSDYLQLFKKLGRNNGNQYVAIENIDLQNTISYISSTIQTKLI